MGIVEDEYIETLEKKQKELEKKLNEYIPYLDKSIYNYYYSLLYFRINAWDQEKQDKYRLFKGVFGDIISFNLQFYMVEAVREHCVHSNYSYSVCDKKTSIFVSRPIAEMSNNSNSEEDWFLKINMPKTYNEKFNARRLEYMKKIHNELRSRGESVYWWFAREIKAIENSNGDNSFDELYKEQKGLYDIIDVLIEKYNIKIPQEYDSSEFDGDISEMSLGWLDHLEDEYGGELVYNETIVQDTGNRKVLLRTPLISSYHR